MWKAERVKSNYEVDLIKSRDQHLEESKKILKILDFYYRVLFDIDGIRSNSSGMQVTEEIIAQERKKIIEKLPPIVREIIDNPSRANKLGGDSATSIENINKVIEREIQKRLNVLDFVTMDLPDYDRVNFWTKLANFTSVSLTDSSINLISHDTWCDVFKGKFSFLSHDDNKGTNNFILDKYDTTQFNYIVDKILARKNFDIKNNNQINGLPSEERDIIKEYKENGPYMDNNVLSDIYDILTSLNNNTSINPRKLKNVRRYLRVVDGKPIFLDERGYRKYDDEFPIYKLLDNGVMEIEFEWQYDDQLRNLVYFNPKRVDGKPMIEDCIIAPAPLCYGSDGKLFTVLENHNNNFIYKYLSLFRNTHAHEAYSVYKNPENDWYVCEGIDGSEIQYSIQWLECLMNNLVGNLDQILYGENSINRGSSRFFDVKTNMGRLASNNEFTLALKPYIVSTMEEFKSKADFVRYMQENFYISVVINDDITLNKAKDILTEIQPYLDEKYAKYFAQYKKNLSVYDYSLKKDGKYIHPNAATMLKEHEKALWERLEKQVVLLLKQKLAEKYKLKNLEITTYPIRINSIKPSSRDNHPNIFGAINYLAERAGEYGLFNNDKSRGGFDILDQLAYIDNISDRSKGVLQLSKLGTSSPFNYEGLNVMTHAINSSLKHLGGSELKGDSISIDDLTIDGMNMYKNEVARLLGVYALYNALIETGYADAVANSEMIKWELEKTDENNISKIDMKYLGLYIGSIDGKQYPQQIKTNSDKKRVLRTIRDALAHGNVFIKEELKRCKNDKDITLQFANSQYVNGEAGGYMVEGNICSIMEFVKNPVFTKPTKHKPVHLALRQARRDNEKSNSGQGNTDGQGTAN